MGTKKMIEISTVVTTTNPQNENCYSGHPIKIQPFNCLMQHPASGSKESSLKIHGAT